MAYGLAEGLRKSAGKIPPKRKRTTVIVGTFGSHFKLEEALVEIQKEGLSFEVEKGHTVKIFLEKNSTSQAEKVKSIVRDHYGYIEPL